MTQWSKQPNREKADEEERASLEVLVETVIGAAYEVSNVLGAGFVEKVYERALLEELRLRDLPTAIQAPFSVVYKGKHVGVYTADLVVGDLLLIEVKCVDLFTTEHLAQCINYLKASGLKLALLINLRRPKVEWRRIVHNL
ncbi:MAG: GxxExxY protein [Bryobacteraceae bacterium]